MLPNSNISENVDKIINDIDISYYVYWYLLKMSNLFYHLLFGRPHQIIISVNELEIKQLSVGLEANCWILKYNTCLKCEQIIDVLASDNPSYKNRYKISIVLRSLLHNMVVILSYTSDESTSKNRSLAYLYKSTEWLEREIWDMFGIPIKGNIDFRRILTDYGFMGYPLRKDFPLTGFSEIYYDDSKKRILYESIEMAQELRIFNFANIWMNKTINSNETFEIIDED